MKRHSRWTTEPSGRSDSSNLGQFTFDRYKLGSTDSPSLGQRASLCLAAFASRSVVHEIRAAEAPQASRLQAHEELVTSWIRPRTTTALPVKVVATYFAASLADASVWEAGAWGRPRSGPKSMPGAGGYCPASTAVATPLTRSMWCSMLRIFVP